MENNNKTKEMSKLIDNSNIEVVKAYPKNRWFNSIIAIMFTIIGVMIGIIIGCLFIIFL